MPETEGFYCFYCPTQNFERGNTATRTLHLYKMINCIVPQKTLKMQRHTSCQLDKHFQHLLLQYSWGLDNPNKNSCYSCFEAKNVSEVKTHTRCLEWKRHKHTTWMSWMKSAKIYTFLSNNPCDVLSKPSLYRLVDMISILKYWKATFWQWNTIQDLFLALHFQFSSSLSREVSSTTWHVSLQIEIIL